MKPPVPPELNLVFRKKGHKDERRTVRLPLAAGVTLYYGAEGTGLLLILSQVVLAFQLPFAIVPLVLFTRDKAKMGAMVAPGWLTFVAGVVAAIIIALNMKLLWDIAAG